MLFNILYVYPSNLLSSLLCFNSSWIWIPKLYITYNPIKNDFEDAVIISGYGSSNSEYALNYSTYWAGGQSQNYKQILSEQFPNNLFYEYWVKKIFAFSKSADIKSVLRSKSRIVFQTGKLNSVEDVVSDIRNEYGLNVMDYKKIRENSNGEKVYEIIISK